MDNTNYNTQIVVNGGYASLPENPTKSGYEFDGWTLNGTNVINPTTITINANTTFVAKFTKLHTVTFTYEGTTKSTQTIRNNGYATNVSIADTTYKIFNGWNLNGTIVNVANTQITTDTTFVADITYRYDVVFKVDNSNYNTQVVTANGEATAPANPSKTGYTFNGWTLNGTDILNVANTSITENTTFIAKFTINSYTVTFKYEDTTLSTQTVNYGSSATNVNATSTTYKVFNGWKLNGTIVNVTNTPITANTTFTADITYKYDVVFKVDNSNYNTQIVTKNNYANVPTAPVKNGYRFDGWCLNGDIVVNVSEIAITGNTTFTAKFTVISYIVTFVSDGITVDTQNVNYNSYATIPTAPSKTNYQFEGWTLDGHTIVNPSTLIITENTTYMAKFSFNIYSLLSGLYDSNFNLVCDMNYLINNDCLRFTGDTLDVVYPSKMFTSGSALNNGVNLVFNMQTLICSEDSLWNFPRNKNLVFIVDNLTFDDDGSFADFASMCIYANNVSFIHGNSICTQNTTIEIHANSVSISGRLFDEGKNTTLVLDSPTIISGLNSIEKWSETDYDVSPMIIYVPDSLYNNYISTYSSMSNYGYYEFAKLSEYTSFLGV